MNKEQIGATLSEMGAKMPVINLLPEDQVRVEHLVQDLKAIIDSYPKKS